ncbi:hypothetical protein ACLKMH_02915 [Psychromonas sp. KJ10-10]|uniref:hypothetical protein n=1 Tax=Psychromonas sp. KJ10-10 TaxID=3391823 RepID=UPI0039B53F70
MANINKEDESNTKTSEQIEGLLNSSEFNIKFAEFKDIFNKFYLLTKEMGSWSESTAQLFYLKC